MLKKASQIAVDNSVKVIEGYKHNLDEKAEPHNLIEGDKAYLDNQLF
jgi:hypothetical protein